MGTNSFMIFGMSYLMGFILQFFQVKNKSPTTKKCIIRLRANGRSLSIIWTACSGFMNFDITEIKNGLDMIAIVKKSKAQ